MAAQARRMIQDQNLNLHFGTSVKGKSNGVSQNKGLGVRKALNDISNAGKPSTLQASKKHNLNVISIEEDTGASKSTFVAGIKANIPKTKEKAQGSTRKALSDLTNSGKPSVERRTNNKLHVKKPTAVAEEENLPDSIAEEGFLHNHQKCVEAQREAMDINHFLKTVGLHTDLSLQLASPRAFPSSGAMKFGSPLRNMEKEDMLKLLSESHSPRTNKRAELLGACDSPPFHGSPKSPPSYALWIEDNAPNFILMPSP